MKTVNRTFLFVNLFYLVIALFIVIESLGFGGEAGLVPVVVGIPTLIMIVAAVVFSFMPAPRRPDGQECEATQAGFGAVAPWGRAAIILGWLAGFFISILLVGFYPSIVLYTFGFLKIQEKVSWAKAAVMTAGLWAVVYVAFDLLMGARLFEGILFGALLPSL